MKKGQYSYQPYGRDFRIYVCTYADGRSSMSDPVRDEPLYRDREAARRRVYELNGWRYKEATNDELRATSKTIGTHS